MIQIPPSAAPDVQAAFREIQRQLDLLLGSANIDLNGRRLINAGAAVGGTDYVTKAQIEQASVGRSGSSGILRITIP